jgi:hypothetical protein
LTEPWIPFLARKKRFLECVVLAWQNVEDLVDKMTFQEFGLNLVHDEDLRIELLRNHTNFGSKLEFLKDAGRLSKIDMEVIKRFQKERNKLFHGNLSKDFHIMLIPEAEKDRLMELALKASQIAVNRGFGVWVDEKTNDLGNKTFRT